MTTMQGVTAACVAFCLALGSPALAQGKGKGKTHAKPKHAVEQHAQARKGCPPGLAKKNPPCVPPGQAKKRSGSDDWRIDVGRSLEGRDYVVVRSWQYGLEPAPRGSDYAVYDGMLVRIDEDTAEVLDLIRAVQAIAD